MIYLIFKLSKYKNSRGGGNVGTDEVDRSKNPK
jgi:hypothetical protein